MIRIVQNGSPVLRKNAKEVPSKLFGSPVIRKIIADMEKTLVKEKDGVALAAPQIGESLRIFVIAPRAFEMRRNPNSGGPEERLPDQKNETGPFVYINPAIIKISRRKRLADEGCLSVRDYYGKILRADKVVIRALHENGQKFTRGASGLLAQIFQHEVDHLNGVLFIDKAKDLYYLPPENRMGNHHEKKP